MKKMPLRFLAYPLLFLALWGCRNDMDKYYDRPDYLRGNAYEYLKEKGNYTYFLQALEMCGYSDALDGRGLYSVFAPNDDAFKRYLAKKGVSSLDQLNRDSLTLLVSYHLIEFSFNRDDFLAFSKTASAEEPEIGDGSCYKFETLSQDAIKMVQDPLTGRDVKVFSQKKFLPVISTRLLKTQKSVDYEGDYKMFFPNINWQGDKDKLYVANAAVLESGIPLDNGYMYLVDEVIDLLPTVYSSLKTTQHKGSYKIFRELYDRFAYMYYDADKTKSYAEVGDSLYMFYHYLPPRAGEDLPDLACEWTVSENEGDYEARLKYAFNCFAPTDEVLDAYIRQFWDGRNYQDVPLLGLYYLLKSHVQNRQVLQLPSVIDNGLEGYYGEKWDLTRKDVKDAQFCSNGVLYGIDKILEPAMFSMVMKPLFQNDRFSTLLNVAHKQGTFTTMVDPEREFTIFAVDDEVLKDKYGISANMAGKPNSSDVIGERVTITQFISEENHSLTEMNGGGMANFINNQVVEGYIEVGQGVTGRKFYPTKRPFHFLYTDNGLIYGEDGQGMTTLNIWHFDYENGDGRGVVYEVADKMGENPYNIGMALAKDQIISGKHQKFYAALLKANLLQIKPENATSTDEITSVEMDWLKGERAYVFAPTNDAWDETQVPTDSVELDRFLKYFFIPLTENHLTDYILPNYGTPGTFNTRHAYSPLNKASMKIDFVDDKRLRITNSDGVSVMTDGSVPYFATDGLIYSIPNLIRAGDN